MNPERLSNKEENADYRMRNTKEKNMRGKLKNQQKTDGSLDFIVSINKVKVKLHNASSPVLN